MKLSNSLLLVKNLAACFSQTMESSTKEEETLDKSSISTVEKSADGIKEQDKDEDFHSLLIPDPNSLPSIPPSAVESNFVRYYATDFIKPGHDQYIYRHANGLCVVGLAPTHVAFKEEGGITAVDFNVGKSDRSEIKVTGKRKRNAQHLESNSALCKVSNSSAFYVVRCCVKGSLLEVNDRLIKQPDLLNSSASAAREGYIAIIMPKPTDWLKIKDSLLTHEGYHKLRGLLN
ncbi:uncharacterized protein A4U43_C07F27900 [Asparagus officinalis]|uniref:Actin-binding transcription modulator n=1 Tax=Asparagus officinalis TaxID=4686 RepID=A0A5P1EHE0_ASPOF|nr:protein Simiate [Asparagus officinalis]ONK64607.1 uncharacterized protein A4U43_C07F27900 [Asparagus officinalis]